MSMLRFMPAKLVHETHRCKFVGHTANYGHIRLSVRTKCKDLGRMTKQKVQNHLQVYREALHQFGKELLSA